MNYLQEILKLSLENNMMLRYICNIIIEKEQTQDLRDIINNISGDLAAQILSGNK